MNSDFLLEAVGYAASALIIVSITQTSILRLRLLGLAGSLTFLFYALAIGAYPIAVVNAVAAAIHIWYLRKLIRHKDEVFRVLHVLPTSRYLVDFLDFYSDEIRGRLQPEFVYTPRPDQLAAFVLRDMVPAGLGKYIYSSDSDLFDGPAPTCVWTDASNRDHAGYLERMGFVERADMPGRYEIPAPTPST
jgi:hypothetical protein